MVYLLKVVGDPWIYFRDVLEVVGDPGIYFRDVRGGSGGGSGGLSGPQGAHTGLQRAPFKGKGCLTRTVEQAGGDPKIGLK